MLQLQFGMTPSPELPSQSQQLAKRRNSQLKRQGEPHPPQYHKLKRDKPREDRPRALLARFGVEAAIPLARAIAPLLVNPQTRAVPHAPHQEVPRQAMP